MSDNLGSGIKLTDDWDLDVDTTGDLATVSGQDELEKDLAMVTAIYFDNNLGETINPRQEANSLKSIENAVRRIFQQDSRVGRVVNIDVRPDQNITDAIIIESEIVADDQSNHDLVIEVEP